MEFELNKPDILSMIKNIACLISLVKSNLKNRINYKLD